VFSLWLAGCSGSDGSSDGVALGEPNDEAAYLYDESGVRSYDLLIADADLEALDADPAAEEYVPGELVFEGKSYGPVGVRYKGSVGAFLGCVSGGESFGMPSGEKTCAKLSMKVSFDEYEPDGRFYGVEKLQFHAMRNDPSFMKERLGYWLFRSMGLPAPRAVHARVSINGELAGLFALVEQIDGRFTRARFEEGGRGNLYKEVWPMHTSEEPYLAALETNRNDEPSVAGMLDFMRALEAAEGEALGSVLDEYTDAEALLSYLAVDRVIEHWDGPLAFYCGLPAGQGANPGPFGNHNYYWYEEEATARFWLVPWDLDFAFQSSPIGGPDAQPWDEPLTGDACVCPQGASFSRIPAGCDKLVQAMAQRRELFDERVRAFLEGPFEGASVAAQLDAWAAQIEPLVAEQRALPEQRGVDGWQAALRGLRMTLDALRTRAASAP
jgi:spore coat protein CotH